MYDAAEYANLPASADIKELFQYITRYMPHNIELETKMRPFTFDYIHAVGDIDPFIKVPRPDGKADRSRSSLARRAGLGAIGPDRAHAAAARGEQIVGDAADPRVRSVEHAEKGAATQVRQRCGIGQAARGGCHRCARSRQG